MSLAWHIARKDLFRLRVIFLLWAGVLTGRMAFAYIQARMDTGSSVGLIVPAWIFGNLFLPLLLVGMTMGALADDSVCDTDAFWITRPIAGGQLLSAKLLVLGLLSLFPVLMTLPWWLAEGYNSGQLAAAFVHTLKWQLIIMVLAAPVAALSASNSRFVVHAILAAAVIATLVVVHIQFAGDRARIESTVNFAVCLRVLLTLWAAVTAAILFNQYRTRRTRRSLAIALAALLLGFGIAAYTGSQPLPPTAVGAPTAARPPGIVFGVAPRMGARSFQDGRGVRVTEYIPNDPRGTVITVSESLPDFSDPKWAGTTSAPADFKRFLFNPASQTDVTPAKYEAYFLVHRTDGRAVRGTATPVGEQLTAATLSYFRRDLTFSPPRDWTLAQVLNFQQWVSGADLVKIDADEEVLEFPHALATATASPRP